jgi:uncharacterized protein YueI
MDPIVHAKNSAKKFGGIPDDYLKIHQYLDISKTLLPDNRHRLFLHNTLGILLTINQFGDYIENSEGVSVPVRYIAESHIIEDLGRIPTIEECANKLDPKDNNDISSRLAAANKEVTKSEKEEGKLWLIMETGWEYDDNYYSKSGAYPVQKRFTSKEEAEKELKQLELGFIEEWVHGYPNYCPFYDKYDLGIEDCEDEDAWVKLSKLSCEEIYEKYPNLRGYELISI